MARLRDKGDADGEGAISARRTRTRAPKGEAARASGLPLSASWPGFRAFRRRVRGGVAPEPLDGEPVIKKHPQ